MQSIRRRRFAWFPGLSLAAALAAVAHLLGPAAKPLPDVVIGLLLGVAVRSALGDIAPILAPGIALTLKYVLRTAIILLGSGLSVAVVLETGSRTLAVIITCVIVAMLLGISLSRLFRLPGVVGTLIGAGTAICGGTAILTIAPLTRATDEEVAYALTTIFTFNIIALLTYPWLGHMLGLSSTAFGSWAGTAVNDTSVVVATGYVYSNAAGAVATIVKLTRTVLLVPLAVLVGFWYAGSPPVAKAQRGVWSRTRASTPWFIFGFVAMASLNSLGLLPATVVHTLTTTATFLIVVVLVAVGLNVDIRQLARMGLRPLVVGLLLASIMALCSFGLIDALKIG
ncbi:MAG: putative sulfate exporter family transporter [Candidatus Eremiobacteraeota bacterium]|nr:putative sulfate exporter family transporter [Candidatus Eremiobacteraeota bacterium]MBC5827920.1 putative sulfate exporter family transporter [Candidatus Eremiobacteraeota bacterium]